MASTSDYEYMQMETGKGAHRGHCIALLIDHARFKWEPGDHFAQVAAEQAVAPDGPIVLAAAPRDRLVTG